MGTLVEADVVQKKRDEKQRSEDQRIRTLIRWKFRTHEDYRLILNLLEEYGSATIAGVIRSTYDPAFAR